jgi:hypothetical protein
MPRCEITASFMESIEKLFPLQSSNKSQWKSTIGDLLNITEWDKVADDKSSWHAIKRENIKEPDQSEIFMRLQYGLQLGVGQLNNLGGRVVKKHPISLKTPLEFQVSLMKLREELEYYRAVAHIKGAGSLQVTNNLGHAEKVSEYLLEMFECIGTGKYQRFGQLLAEIFHELTLPKDMMLKTARKLLSL